MEPVMSTPVAWWIGSPAAAGPCDPIAKWVTAFGILIGLVFVAVGLWVHRQDWDEMRAARRARRARRQARREGRRARR